MDKLKDILNTLMNGWKNLDTSKKRTLIIVVSFAVILMAGLAYVSQKSHFTVLFSELDEADAGLIVENLETEGIEYKLEDGGKTILIDEAQVDQYRIQLASNGLMPVNSTGFEIFDETSMMATDEDREIMYQRAVTGELERSISSLQQVESAKVMLSIPEDSIFQNPDYKSEASASIVLETRGSGLLTTQNIQGIASLVSGAVDQLPMENIQIVDSNGNLLSGFLQDSDSAIGAADVSTQQLSVQQTYEQDLEKRITSLLAPVYGAQNIRVVVNASMNFDAIEGETVEYTAPMTDEGEEVEDPEGLIRSQSENYNGASDMIQGLIEQGELPAADDAADEEQNTSLDRTINYELDQKTEKYVRAPGVLEAVNASVVINQNAEVTPAEAELRPIIEQAIGLNTPVVGGEDEAVVQGEVAFQILPFADGEELEPIGEDFMTDLLAFFRRYWPFMVGGIVLLITGIIILSILRRGRKDEFNEFESAFENAGPAPSPQVEAAPVEPAPIDLNSERKKQKNKVMNDKEDLVREEAKQNPELAAELMKIWLKE